ncbi:PTS lactose/cellobiose transporter subunit IIA [Massilicoli timonensis]|uniref:PTS lactose/cellobiose transporter subunit IIA n=1 Tax=Massilicoli timonensis TaxID=2015901 RepID=UPI000C83944D|nr:PTS lactose/cellobiose transporter subunit IIA [Massilicoli timonensis]
MEQFELICFQIISHAGGAKSKCYEALHCFQNGDVKQFAKLMEECNQLFIEAHKIHASLIQKEAAKEKVELSLLLIHAEDQLSSAELVRDTVNQMVALLKEVHDLKAEIQEIKKNID